MDEEYYYRRKDVDLNSEYLENVPESLQAFEKFDKQVFSDGVLSKKAKELIALGCAHITRCPYCIEGHTKRALADGASRKEIAEAIMVAIAMNAGASFAHGHFALKTETSKSKKKI